MLLISSCRFRSYTQNQWHSGLLCRLRAVLGASQRPDHDRSNLEILAQYCFTGLPEQIVQLRSTPDEPLDPAKNRGWIRINGVELSALYGRVLWYRLLPTFFMQLLLMPPVPKTCTPFHCYQAKHGCLFTSQQFIRKPLKRTLETSLPFLL
jgi:hypothetical protein